jgi:hypothetical protein
VTNVTVNLIEPGTLYGDRLNQLDLRVARILRFGSSRFHSHRTAGPDQRGADMESLIPDR